MKKLIITDDCIDCGNCYGAYPEIFQEGDGKAEPKKADGFTPEEEKDIEAAIAMCGAGDAIQYEEAEASAPAAEEAKAA